MFEVEEKGFLEENEKEGRLRMNKVARESEK